MKLRTILSESVRSIGANVSTSIAAIVTVLIGMFLVGLFIALGTWMLSWTDAQKDKLEVKVYFCVELTCGKEATAQQINAVREKAEAHPLVKRVEFVSKKEALAEMRKDHPDLVNSLPTNPLPHSLELEPRRGEDINAISESLRPLPPGVEKVKDGEETSDRILRVATAIFAVVVVAAILLAAAATLLIANTIRLSIFSRRREIEVMKLVGATNWFVRGPFMLEGLICGVLGSVAAVVLLLLGKEVALPAILPRMEDSSDVNAISFWANAAIIVGMGLTLGALGSGLTLRRFLNV